MSLDRSSPTDHVGRLLERLDRPSSVLGAVFVGAFLETTVLPVPFELLLVPLMLRHRAMLWPIVLAALAGCLVGAFAGYAIGAFAFQTIGRTALQGLGAEPAMEAFAARFEDNGFLSVFLVGFTPVPVQVATLGAGFLGMSLPAFAAAMLLSRGLRYAGLGLLVFRFGEGALRLLRRHRGTALVAGLILTAALVLLLFGPAGASSSG